MIYLEQALLHKISWHRIVGATSAVVLSSIIVDANTVSIYDMLNSLVAVLFGSWIPGRVCAGYQLHKLREEYFTSVSDVICEIKARYSASGNETPFEVRMLMRKDVTIGFAHAVISDQLTSLRNINEIPALLR